MYAEQFKEDGVAVIPLFNLDETKCLKRLFRNAIFSQPEFKDPKLTETEAHTMGGFCAMGTGSSFHHPFHRKLRELVFQRMLPKFWNDMVGDKPDWNVEFLLDRALFRPKTRKVGAESYHQDKPDKKVMEKLGMEIRPDDITCGGWLNLDSFDQFFGGLKGTHKDKFGADGFARIPKNKLPYYKAKAKQQGKIRIPPGCLIIFYESIVHNVTSNKMKQDMHRQFIGWRITKDLWTLFPDTLERCRQQLPIRLKSGQEPPMYSQMHLTNWIERVEEWSKNVKDEYCYKHTVQSGKNAGKTFRICHRFVGKLKKKMPYPNYTSDELTLLCPMRSWNMREWKFLFNYTGIYSTDARFRKFELKAPDEVRDVTADIQFDEEQKKRAAEVDLTKQRRKKKRKKHKV